MDFLKQFKLNRLYTFDKTIYEQFQNNNIEQESDNSIDVSFIWASLCNGKEVEIINNKLGQITIEDTVFEIVPQWCKKTVRLMNNNDF